MEEKDVYFASCVPDGGIYHYKMNGSGMLHFLEKVFCPSPMYMIKKDRMLHVILRHPFDGNDSSGIVSYMINPDGKLHSQSGIINTRGRCGCHLCCFHGKLYSVNYLSGNIFCSDGFVSTHHGHGKNVIRQEAPHPHYIGPSPDGNYLLVTDLGLDKIFVYDGSLHLISSVALPSGSGPRHIAAVDLGHIVCVNELDCSVTMLEYNGGVLSLVQTLQLLAPGQSEQASGAAIRPYGHYIYVSNRGNNTICAVKLEGGRMKQKSVTFCGGKMPRDFMILGKYMICANQGSSTVTVFKVEKEKLTYVNQEEEVFIPEVLCVC